MILNFSKLFLAPLQEIHFINRNQHCWYSQCSHDICMFFGLPSESKSAIKFRTVYYQYRIICLNSSIYHVWYILFVTWWVQENYCLPIISDVPHPNINCNSFVPFVLVLIHNPSKLERLFSYLLWLFLIFMDLLLRNKIELMENLSC